MAAANTMPCVVAKSPCAVAPRPAGAIRARKCMLPRWVAAKLSACRPCRKGSAAVGGSNAMAVQRITPPIPPSTIIGVAPSAATARAETANRAISARTPRPHSRPIAGPAMPLALHCSVAKPYMTAWLAWIRLVPITTVMKTGEPHNEAPAPGRHGREPGEPERRRGGQPQRRHHGPDHVLRAQAPEQQSAGQIGDDEGHRAP